MASLKNYYRNQWRQRSTWLIPSDFLHWGQKHYKKIITFKMYHKPIHVATWYWQVSARIKNFFIANETRQDIQKSYRHRDINIQTHKHKHNHTQLKTDNGTVQTQMPTHSSYSDMHIYTNRPILMYKHTYTYIHIIYIYIHTHIHTYIYIYTSYKIT